MEPHGRRQGGYSDGYGDENLGMMFGPLCNITKDKAICEKARAVRCQTLYKRVLGRYHYFFTCDSCGLWR